MVGELRACKYGIAKEDAPYKRFCLLLRQDCFTRIVKCPYVRDFYRPQIEALKKAMPKALVKPAWELVPRIVIEPVVKGSTKLKPKVRLERKTGVEVRPEIPSK